MKKITLLSLLPFFLVGCSSPPEPVPFPKTKDSNLNALQTYRTEHKVPLNRLDLPEWRFAIITHSEILNEDQKTKFWYLAHHATDIEILGDYSKASNLRQLMISNGVTAKITIKDNYARSSTLSIDFMKVKPQNETTSIKENL